jgi:hypothetical protein
VTRLPLSLFDRRYDDLVELGRSMIPAHAPDWTDHNAHDPGMTLMELLAWVAEAQMYSLGRMRRDERLAYAALVGIAPRGTRAARGFLWPERSDRSASAATFTGTRVVGTDASIRIHNQDRPELHPERKTLVFGGDIVSVRARLATGVVRDLTASNSRGVAFLPFGGAGGPDDRLILRIKSRDPNVPLPDPGGEGKDAYLSIGVRVADDSGGRDQEDPTNRHPRAIVVTLVAGGERYDLDFEDSTFGLLVTGVIALKLPGIPRLPETFDLVIEAPTGYARPPRLCGIHLNVLPITEKRRIEGEEHDANGQPGFHLELKEPGLCFEAATEAVSVEASVDGTPRSWKRCERLADHGPAEPVFELDAQRCRVLFGNGVNGLKPAAESKVYVSYAVSTAAAGNVAAGRKWTVAGFEGVFGTNLDAIAGGEEPPDWTDMRRQARRRSSDDHALVTSSDIERAAIALRMLDVARAWVVKGDDRHARTGAVQLVVIRRRQAGEGEERRADTARWLEAIRLRLAPRMPLGSRLVVKAPKYVDFQVRAELQIEAGRAAAEIESEVRRALADRTSLVESSSAPQARLPGVPIARSEVAAWILSVRGVVAIRSLDLLRGDRVVSEVAVKPDGLPRLQVELSTFKLTTEGGRAR